MVFGILWFDMVTMYYQDNILTLLEYTNKVYSISNHSEPFITTTNGSQTLLADNHRYSQMKLAMRD